MEKKSRRRLLLIITLMSMIMGMFFSVIIGGGYIEGTDVDYVLGARSMSISSGTKTDIILDTTRVTEVFYSGESEEYVLHGTHKDLDGFKIEYLYKDEGQRVSTWHTIAPSDVKSRNHGTQVDTHYEVRITRPEDETYNAYDSGEFYGLKIKPLEVWLQVNDETITYGDNLPTFSARVVDSSGNDALISGDNMIEDIYTNDTPEFITDYDMATDGVGDHYEIKFKYESFSSALNYDVQDYLPGILTVTPATISYTSKGYSGVYDSHPHGIEVKVLSPIDAEVTYSIVEGEECINPSASQSVVTDGSITVYFKIYKPNYTPVYGSETLNITKRRINVDIDDVTIVEGGTRLEPRWSLSDPKELAENDTLEDLDITLVKFDPENYKHGKYVITGICNNPNYDVAWTNGRYTITATNIYNIHNTSVLLDCAQGLDPDYTLSIEDKTDSLSKLDIKGVAGDNTQVILAYDIEVLDQGSNVVDVSGRSELKLKVRLTKEQKDIKNYQVVYVDDDGKMAKVDSEVKIVGDYLVFTVEHLSTYLIIGDKVPEYLENIIGLMVVADMVLLLCFILLKNKNKHLFYSISPFMLSAGIYVPMASTIAVIVLALVTIVLTVLIFRELLKDGDIRNKYDYSFTAKILLSKKTSVINKYYSKLRNKLYSYKNVRSIVTWNGEIFYLGDIELAKIMIDRSYLDLYVAIEHGFFRHTNYDIKNVIKIPAVKTTPSKLNIDNDEDYLDAVEIIDMVAEKYGLIKSRKFVDVDYSTRKVALATLIRRGLVITDRMIENESSIEAKEIKNIYKARYTNNKSMKHLTMTNNDNSLSMSIVEVTEDFKTFTEKLKGCTGKCINNYTKIKNLLLTYETITDRIESNREILYLGHVMLNVMVNDKHIFVTFIGDRDELLRVLPIEKIDENIMSISYDLQYEENVTELCSHISKFALSYDLLRMSDYKQKNFKSLILDT